VTKIEIAQTDIDQIERYIEMHEARIETFGKKEYSGRIFADMNPKSILPILYRLRDELKQELKQHKSKKKK
jgi:hypothetical protein